MPMKSLESLRNRGSWLRFGLSAVAFVLLAGCSQMSRITSQVPIVALRMEPGYMNGTDYERALMLYEKGFLVEAREKATAVKKGGRDYAGARRLIAAIDEVVRQVSAKHMDLGENYEKAGIYRSAMLEYSTALKYDPSNREAQSRMSALADAIKEGKQSRINQASVSGEQNGREADNAAKGKSREQGREYMAKFHYTRGRLYLDKKDYAKAAEEFDMAMRLVPSYMDAGDLLAVSERERDRAVEAHLKKGISYFQAEEMDLAIKEWESALRYDPENRAARDYKNRAEVILERLKSIREKQESAGAPGRPL